ncbi:uncharacterized protein LOC106477931, partial [Limulus polyphemus]|uniref:Uncharacterized protein LOC106477931 n=1 Tax=Limulus polyphemus TaxID=6850 RepID=A0ABM1C4C5_LIMPO
MDGSSASDAALSAYFSLPISSLSGLRCMPFYAMPVAASGVRQNQRFTSADDKDPPVDIQSLLPNGLGEDPRQWNKDEVMQWLDWMTEQLSLPASDPEHFHMN